MAYTPEPVVSCSGRPRVPVQGVHQAVLPLMKAPKKGLLQASLPAFGSASAGSNITHGILLVCRSVSKFPPFNKGTNIKIMGLPCSGSISTNYICNNSISKSVYIPRYWGLELQHMDFFFGRVEHNSTCNSLIVGAVMCCSDYLFRSKGLIPTAAHPQLSANAENRPQLKRVFWTKVIPTPTGSQYPTASPCVCV